LVVRFGRWHSLEEEFHQWKTSFVSEHSLQFPQLLVHSANQGLGGASCKQGSGTAITYTPVSCPVEFLSGQLCYILDLSRWSSSGTEAFQYMVECTLNFNAVPAGNNTDLYLRAPVRFGKQATGQWDRWGTPVRPNDRIGVHLEPVRVFPHNVPGFIGWGTDVHYWSTIFTRTNVTYSSTLNVLIPYTVVSYMWESVPQGAWGLLAVWGGGMFFMYFLHALVFSLAKLILPDDSQLLRASTPSASGFEPIK